MNYIILVIIIIIFMTLGSAFIGMLKGDKKSSELFFKSLRLRIILSVCLFLFLIFAGIFGLIEPNNPMF